MNRRIRIRKLEWMVKMRYDCEIKMEELRDVKLHYAF